MRSSRVPGLLLSSAKQASMLPNVAERELLGIFRSAEFRFLGSPVHQMQFLRTQPREFTLQTAANLFNESLTTAHGALKRLRLLNEAADPEFGNAVNSSRLTCSGELNVTGWIEARQRQSVCPSPTEVRDYAGGLLLQQRRDDSGLGRPWWRSFKKRHAQELHASTVSGKEPTIIRLPCQHGNRYFREVIEAPSKYKSLKQILYMDESGVAAHLLKGKRRKVVSLIACPVEPHFQDIRDVSNVSAVETVSLGFSSLPPLFLAVSDINSRDPEWRTIPGGLQPSIRSDHRPRPPRSRESTASRTDHAKRVFRC
jgi:hypothetical protein